MGLFKGMTPAQAHQTSMDIFKTGIGAALEKQRRDEEKKRLDFEQKFKQQTFNLQKKELELLQTRTDMENALKKAKLEGLLKFQQAVHDVRQPTGRRSILPLTPEQRQAGMPTGVPVPPAQRQAQKAWQIAMLGAQYGQPVPAAIGQMAKPPEKEKPSERYHWDNGGLFDYKEMKWIIPPKGTDAIVTIDNILDAYNTLEKMGIAEDYQIKGYFRDWFRYGQPHKEKRTKEVNEFIKRLVGGNPVTSEVFAIFPDLGFRVKSSSRNVTPNLGQLNIPTPTPVGLGKPQVTNLPGISSGYSRNKARGTKTTGLKLLNPEKQNYINYLIQIEKLSPQEARIEADKHFGK